jgi:2,3-bisphosphoglycerate-dependent phosphoglycerate mutase
MKKIFLLLILSFYFIVNQAQEVPVSSTEDITTYYFIRHAEIDQNNPKDKNPKLSDIGHQRAENWAEILKEVPFNIIYSTDYYRTKETAKPIAKLKNLPITLYDLNYFNLGAFKKSTNGKSVLVVGHSNSTPNMVNEFIETKKYTQIKENNYSNIYIITLIGTTASNKLLTIN